jgi:hypothetical protein
MVKFGVRCGDLVVYFLFQNKELIPAPQNNNLPLITKSQ